MVEVMQSGADIIGLDEEGCIIVKDRMTGMEIPSGDTPEKWGWHNMTPEEVMLVKKLQEQQKTKQVPS